MRACLSQHAGLPLTACGPVHFSPLPAYMLQHAGLRTSASHLLACHCIRPCTLWPPDSLGLGSSRLQPDHACPGLEQPLDHGSLV